MTTTTLPGAPVALSDIVRRHPRAGHRFASAHAALLRGTRGLLAARWFGSPVLLLETTGRRTGDIRRTPLVYLADGDDLVVVAANAGAERPPAWWRNLEAAGRATAIVGGKRRTVAAAVVEGQRRDALWRRFAAVSPVEHYQRQTARRLPVVALTPQPASTVALLRRPVLAVA